MAEKENSAQIAIIDDSGTLTYKELLTGSRQLAYALATDFQLAEETKTALLCRNHSLFVQALFAASRTGTAIYLLNPDMSQSQFNSLIAVHNFDVLLFDEEFSRFVTRSSYQNKKLSLTGELKTSMSHYINHQNNKAVELKRSSGSKIILLTGGTTGKPKKAEHKPSLFNFLNPFAALIRKLGLRKEPSGFIASPLYYGYGIAFLFAVLALGKTAIVQHRFDARQACALIQKHRIETVSAVPLMIEKMLNHHAADLRSLRCIASGGAKLNTRLIERIKVELGDVLCNLYGTTEVGLSIIAGPHDLHRDSRMAGKAIRGAQLKIMENGRQAISGQTGQLYARNGWSMSGKKDKWIATGDLAWKDDGGFYYLSGRVDEMVVSGGVNIYPLEIEKTLVHHPLIAEAAVIGIENEVYGQVLKAYVQPVFAAPITEKIVLEWLESQVARIQLPRVVCFVEEMPYTALGKPDKNKLISEQASNKELYAYENDKEQVGGTFPNASDE